MARDITIKKVFRTTYTRNLQRTHPKSNMLMLNIPMDIVNELGLAPLHPCKIRLQKHANEGADYFLAVEF